MEGSWSLSDLFRLEGGFLALKQDHLLKEWMAREKAAVDYARTRDKRIAQLEAEADQLQSQLRAQGAAEARKPAL